MTSVRIAHISDPHFGTTTPAKKQALAEKLKELAPDLIALSGDITQRARREEFKEAREFCEALSPLKVLAVPGNHDIPLFNLAARFLYPYFGFRRQFGFPRSGRARVGDVVLIGVDSTHPSRHVQGELSKRDRAELAGGVDDSLVRVAMFHHPLDCSVPSDEKNILKDAASALRALETAKIDLVLSGHIHNPLMRLSNERYPKAQRPMIVTVAGTCLSSRTRAGAPNSFNLIDIESASADVRIKVSRYDLSVDCHFLVVSDLIFVREGRDRWREESACDMTSSKQNQ